MQQSDAQVVLWCTRAAEQDYPSACLRLGHAYNFGHFGLDKSFTFAASYYERAVKGGDTDGMGCFAECLLRGEGVDASEAKAMYWYSRNCGGDISAEMWFSGGSYPASSRAVGQRVWTNGLERLVSEFGPMDME